MELRDRVKAWELPRADLDPQQVAATPSQPLLGGALEEAESALIALGYRPTEAARMVSAAGRENPEASSQELIRTALRSISQLRSEERRGGKGGGARGRQADEKEGAAR